MVMFLDFLPSFFGYLKIVCYIRSFFEKVKIIIGYLSDQHDFLEISHIPLKISRTSPILVLSWLKLGDLINLFEAIRLLKPSSIS